MTPSMEEVPSVRQIRKIRAAATMAAKSQKMAQAAFLGSELEHELWLTHDQAVATLLQAVLNEDGTRALDEAEAALGLRERVEATERVRRGHQQAIGGERA